MKLKRLTLKLTLIILPIIALAYFIDIDSKANQLLNETTPTFKVIFISDGKILSEQMVESRSGAIAPDTPRKIGHKFIGWDIPFSRIYEDTTVNAKWEKEEYLVQFMSGKKVISEQYVPYEESAKKPKKVPIKDGYDFVKWDKSYSSITEDLKVNAVYKVVTVNVMFSANSGKIDGKMMKLMKCKYGEKLGNKLSKIKKPKKLGYKFKGWYTNVSWSKSNKKITSKTSVLGWTPKIDTVTGKRKPYIIHYFAKWDRIKNTNYKSIWKDKKIGGKKLPKKLWDVKTKTWTFNKGIDERGKKYFAWVNDRGDSFDKNGNFELNFPWDMKSIIYEGKLSKKFTK